MSTRQRIESLVARRSAIFTEQTSRNGDPIELAVAREGVERELAEAWEIHRDESTPYPLGSPERAALIERARREEALEALRLGMVYDVPTRLALEAVRGQRAA